MSNKKEEKKSVIQKAIEKRPQMQLPFGLAQALINDRVAIRYEMPKDDYDFCKNILATIYDRKVDNPHASNLIYLFGLYALAIESQMTEKQLNDWGQATLQMPNYDSKKIMYIKGLTVQSSAKILGETRLSKLYDLTAPKFRKVSNDTFIAYLGMVLLRRVAAGEVSPFDIDEFVTAAVNGDLKANLKLIKSDEKPNIEAL